MTHETDPKVPHDLPLPGHHDLQEAEHWSRLHNAVLESLTARAKETGGMDSRLLEGLLEIAEIMLKNTCGVGSNIRLAECELAAITEDNIRRFYTQVLATLAFHFGTLLPNRREAIWDEIRILCADADSCAELAHELEECRDHECGDFSPVRAGRKLWEHAAGLLHVRHADTNVTARIYYQTAPGQDLVYLVEQAADEGWLRE